METIFPIKSFGLITRFDFTKTLFDSEKSSELIFEGILNQKRGTYHRRCRIKVCYMV